MSFYSFSNLTSVTTIFRHLKLFKCILMFVIMSVLCLFTEGLREDWLYQLSHPPKLKYLLTYLLTFPSEVVFRGGIEEVLQLLLTKCRTIFQSFLLSLS